MFANGLSDPVHSQRRSEPAVAFDWHDALTSCPHHERCDIHRIPCTRRVPPSDRSAAVPVAPALPIW